MSGRERTAAYAFIRSVGSIGEAAPHDGLGGDNPGTVRFLQVEASRILRVLDGSP
jgi:hypothetical protein